MSINVSLETLSIPEVLKLIHTGEKTGRLTIEKEVTISPVISNKNYSYLWFKQGCLITSFSPSSEASLIEVIKNKNWLKNLIVDKVDKLCPDGKALGTYLEEMNLLNSEQINWLFQVQLDWVYQLFSYTCGRLKFEELSVDFEADLPWLEMTGKSINVLEVNLNGLRLLPNWEYFERRLPEPNLGLKKLTSVANFELIPLESHIYNLADGKTSLNNIAKQLNQSLLTIQKTAFCLIASQQIQEIPLGNNLSTLIQTQLLPAKKNQQNRKKIFQKDRVKSIFSGLKKTLGQFAIIAITAPSITILTIALNTTGAFQLTELSNLDRFFRWRPLEEPDPHITVVTIDESDLNELGYWPMSDSDLSQIINNLKKHQPIVIGLDIYRNLIVEPGHQKLLETYQSTPNFIGVEKYIGEKVSPPKGLTNLEQVAIADVILDPDGKLRRSLITLETETGEIKIPLGVKLALIYLDRQQVALQEVNPEKYQYKLGKTLFTPLEKNSGAYVNLDTGGYQILLNFRGIKNSFTTISLSDVLANRIPDNLIRDRLILIGATGESLKDFVQTSYHPQTAGVLIHANAASQIISAAMDGRPLLKVVSEPLEWIWILSWSIIGATVGLIFLNASLFKKSPFSRWILLAIYLVITAAILLAISYLLFLLGWWLPIVSPLVALMGSALTITAYHSRELQQLAFMDGLTQIANRRYFDRYLEQEWQVENKEKQIISIILCDVDFFKLYNDCYGHQKGDECLQKVAQAINQAIRKTDLVARYGGEEFVVTLPKTNAENAIQVANRMLERIAEMKIPHAQSKVSEYVSMSCGVATTIISADCSPAQLIAMADEALYLAKKHGRARAILSPQSY